MTASPPRNQPAVTDARFEIESVRMRLTMHQVFLAAVTGWIACSTFQLGVATGVLGLVMLFSLAFVVPWWPEVYQLLGMVRLTMLKRRVTWVVLGAVVAVIALHFVARGLVSSGWAKTPGWAHDSIVAQVMSAIFSSGILLFIFTRFLPVNRYARLLCLIGFSLFAGGVTSLHLELIATGSLTYYIDLAGPLGWICPGCAVQYHAFSTNLGGVLRQIGALLYLLGLSSWLGSLRRRSDAAIRDVLIGRP